MMGFFPALVFIPRFYASDVGVPLALVGTYILVARVVDVVAVCPHHDAFHLYALHATRRRGWWPYVVLDVGFGCGSDHGDYHLLVLGC